MRARALHFTQAAFWFQAEFVSDQKEQEIVPVAMDLHHGREVRRAASDQRAPMLGERPRDGGVDVLVREVQRRAVAEGRGKPNGEADRHDPGQEKPGRNGGNARERVRPRDGYVDCHTSAIGRPPLSLERGIPGQSPPSASGTPVARSNGTNKRQ